MAYPGRQNIYEATIRRMVQQAIEEQEQQFRQQHETDTDEQMISYLRTCAVQLQHSPWPGEIVGGGFIQERFGTWQQALSLAKLPMPRTPKQAQTFARVQEETERQKKVYRQRKAEKKMHAAQKRAQQAAKKKPVE